MGLKDTLTSEVATILKTAWSTREGSRVPDAEDLRLGNDAVTFNDAVVLYADLADSTELVRKYKDWFAAQVYKSYLHCSSKIIKDHDGVITAFDGDRVMAVFIGGSKCTNAAKAALKIKSAVSDIINPAIKARYSSTKYEVHHAVGIDISKQFIARTGVRGDNDLVWVGRAANYAAKLCALREYPYSSFITPEVYGRLADDAKYGGESRREMWEAHWWPERRMSIYRSSWKWTP